MYEFPVVFYGSQKSEWILISAYIRDVRHRWTFPWKSQSRHYA